MTLAIKAPPSHPRRMTREEYARLPEGPPYYELIDGRLEMSPSPASRHSALMTYLIELMGPHARGQLGGRLYAELDLYLPGTENIYRPDLVYVTRRQLRLARQNAVHGVPYLICEILSPGTANKDRYLKLPEYCRAGVPHYWLLDPEEVAIEEFVLSEDGHYRVQTSATPPSVWSPLAFPEWSFDLGVALAALTEPPEDALIEEAP